MAIQIQPMLRLNLPYYVQIKSSLSHSNTTNVKVKRTTRYFMQYQVIIQIQPMLRLNDIDADFNCNLEGFKYNQC